MDAKPQRPVRSLIRVYDENTIPHDMPGMMPGKSIHHRNRSSPALSSLAQAGALRATAASKRTAFGDISNSTAANTASLRSSRDDSQIGAGMAMQAKENLAPAAAGQDKRSSSSSSSTFQKPAQRPLSMAGLRGLTSAAFPSSRQPLGDLSQRTTATTAPVSVPSGNAADAIRKQTNKRISTIFRDPAPASNPIVQSSAATVVRPVPVNPPAAKAREQHAALLPPSTLPQQHRLQHSSSTYIDAPEYLDDDDHHDLLDDEAIDPALQVVAGFNNWDSLQNVDADLASKIAALPSKVVDYVPAADHHSAPIPYTSVAPYRPLDRERDRHTRLPPIAEPGEASPTQEHGANLTEKSSTLKNDTVTSTTTTILFPRMTQRAQNEIAQAKQIIETSKTAEELQDEAWDTTMVAEYGDEIFDYMKELELRLLPNAHYMANQAEIQWSMRAVLMDWIVQVHHRFNLLPETLFLCVNYIDRFLSCKVVSLGKLQLVGITAIFIASKYEEIECPSVQEILYMVDGGYTMDELLKAERFMLSMLQFELGWPGPMSFLRRISKADDYDLETRTLAKYFLELTIMDERFIGSPPSYVAAGAHCLARLMLRKGKWSTAHVYYSNYTYSQLYELMALMVDCCEDPRKHHSAIYEKYMDKRFKRASTFAETEMKRGFQLPMTSTPAVASTSTTEAATYPNSAIDARAWLPSNVSCEA